MLLVRVSILSRVVKLNQLLQGNLAQISSIELAARRCERRADIINQLGEEVKELNQIVQEKDEELSRMEDIANRQNAKQAGDIRQLEAELRKLNQLLQEKGRFEKQIRMLKAQVSGMVSDMDQQKEKYEEIQGMIYNQNANNLYHDSP
ncbi:hypothetical protein M378DRAFT_167915 [Amanita muscaria Koide BX008]|uniref:Uncharacterized protein n=1 Tax=Amanita muscaria (strain Koide BX008) TaxID=946122 RepID=A0A0C2WGU7_AMAMK|nr:hypothetical protein M378DRAFT_167915 [Amanita muscaria Koide BX008]